MTEQRRSPAIAVVTGANKGIGLDIVRQLAVLGWSVWLGSRDAERGQAAVDMLTSEGLRGHVHLLPIDVTDDDSVTAAARTVARTGVDVLVNNAGIAVPVRSPADATADDVEGVLAVNVLGPIWVTHAFLPLLAASSRPQVVNISSGLGSFAAQTSAGRDPYPDLAYPVSKAALNMITVQYAKHLPNIRFAAVGPGYTATDLNGFAGHQTTAGAAANVLSVIADEELPSPSYISAEGASGW
jgi:NAD(P)-dependent dehydrogenase (short-subunit alcohol dehydrogenase family)